MESSGCSWRRRVGSAPRTHTGWRHPLRPRPRPSERPPERPPLWGRWRVPGSLWWSERAGPNGCSGCFQPERRKSSSSLEVFQQDHLRPPHKHQLTGAAALFSHLANRTGQLCPLGVSKTTHVCDCCGPPGGGAGGDGGPPGGWSYSVSGLRAALHGLQGALAHWSLVATGGHGSAHVKLAAGGTRTEFRSS